MWLQPLIFSQQYSTERISAAIWDMSPNHRAIYCKLGANTAHILQFTLSELWSRTYKLWLQPLIFSHQYSIERISGAIGDMSTIHRAIYCKLGANTAHILQFTLSDLCSRTYTMWLQPLIFSHQYSSERIPAATCDMSTIQCALYCKHCAKYSAHPPDYAIWILVPAIYSVITAPHIQASIFNWTYLRWYWRYGDNSTSIVPQTWCQYSAQPPVYAIWTVVPDIYNELTAPHIQASIFNWTYLRR
jgi:hypothetical protein